MLLVAVGLALTGGRSINLTASRIRSRTRRMRLAAVEECFVGARRPIRLAAVLLTISGLRTPPGAMAVAAQYCGYASAAPIVWAATMSAGVHFLAQAPM